MAYIVTFEINGDTMHTACGSLDQVKEVVREHRAAGRTPSVSTESGQTINVSEDAIQGK